MPTFPLAAVLLSLLLVAPAAAATGKPASKATAKTAITSRPAQHGDGAKSSVAPAAPQADDDAQDSDDDSSDDVQSDDALGIQEDVTAGQKEMEDLEKAESQAIPDSDYLPRHFGRMGVGNPLHDRIFDSEHWDGGDYGVPTLVPEGDAGGLLAELGGMDLATLKAEYDIPIEINADVIEYIRFFQGPGRKWYAHWLERSKRWIPIMRPILAEEGVPLDLVYLAMIESGFSPFAYSWARASGYWQFISGTGKRFGLRDDFWVDERRDPILSTRAAARYLKALHDQFGSWYLAWASYNAGEGKIRRAVKRFDTHDFWEISHSGNFLRAETKHYVPKLIAAALIAKHPERFGFKDIVAETPFTYEEVSVPDATDLHVLAKAAGVSVDEIQEMNPSLRRWCTPPPHKNAGYEIRVPVGSKSAVLAELAREPNRLTFRHHRVKWRESVGWLAREFHTNASAILRMNGIASARRLRAGMDLIIPMSQEYAQNVPDSGANWKEPHVRHRWRRSSRWAARMARRRWGRGGRRYVIRRGDTLWAISRKFGVGVKDLRRWNGVWSTHRLQVGKAIYIGGRSRRGTRTASVRVHRWRG